MELEQVYQIWDRFENSQVGELELELSGMKIHLRKDGKSQGTAPAIQQEPVEDTKAVTTNPVSKMQKEVKALLVGTFYRAPESGAAPYVEVGQQVKKGDVIGIIEAMKLMNEVVAEEDGIIDQILVQDQEFVEYDQVLMTLK